MLLRKRIKELQPDGDDDTNLEETKESRDGRRQGELLDVRINTKWILRNKIGGLCAYRWFAYWRRATSSFVSKWWIERED